MANAREKYAALADDIVEAEEAVWEAMNRADNLYAHLRRNIRQAIQHPALDSPSKVRRMSGLQWRMHRLDMAHLEVRQAFDALVDAKDQVPEALDRLRASARGRRKAEVNDEARGKAAAMSAIRAEWLKMQAAGVQHLSDAEFARKMYAKYGKIIRNEGSIKNAITRWRKELG